MNPETGPAQAESGRKNNRTLLMLTLFLGILAGQFSLYGPSLLGHKILLPLDILQGQSVYYPRTEGTNRGVENVYLSDLVYVFEPVRRFAHAELASGRFPCWTPWQYAGAPFSSPKFSPFLLLQYAFESPRILPWANALVAVVAGFGACLFCKRVLRTDWWPAVFAGWAYPLTGFFVFWQGYPTGLGVCWLPWLLLSVDAAVRRSHWAAPAAVALVTGLCLVSGHLDMGLQVCGVGLLYGVAGIVLVRREAGRQEAIRLGGSLALAFALGGALSAPYALPLAEYTSTSTRMAARATGYEERPPFGLKALPECVLPDIYGQYGPMKRGSFRYQGDNQMEGAAAGYAGAYALLFLAPLAFAHRGNRTHALVLGAAAVLGVAWVANLFPIVVLMRLPGLNMVSHNRLVFVTAFGVLVLAGMGLQALKRPGLHWHNWMWGPALASAAVCGFCCFRVLNLPEPIATQLEARLAAGNSSGWIYDLESLRQVQASFAIQFAAGAFLSGLALACWVLLRLGSAGLGRLWWFPGLVLLGDLAWFGQGRSVQADPALYFRPVKALEAIRNSPPGRVAGFHCLPANLSVLAGLDDVRGYDGVDPAPMVELLSLAAHPASTQHTYAKVQWFAPQISWVDGQLRLPPALDLLGLRYVIFRGPVTPGATALFQEQDYWVAENKDALQRVFIPAKTVSIPDKAQRLNRLKSSSFDPRREAIVEEVGAVVAGVSGSAKIAEETPAKIRIEAHMATPGVLVLTDQWNTGWRASVNGVSVPVLKVNHALRGVRLPEGNAVVEFRYSPRSFHFGLALAGLAFTALTAWTLASVRKNTAQASAAAC